MSLLSRYRSMIKRRGSVVWRWWWR